MDKILEFLNSCGVFYLATSCGNQAKVRPMNFARNIDGKLSFYTSKQKDLYKQLNNNPLAEISAAGKGGWIRIHGAMSFNDSPEIFEKWAAEAEYFRFTNENKVVCSFDTATVEYMPGYQAALPDFIANWEKTIMPEGEIKYTGKL
ncbi:MAG: pyridoxamine 5'-phosphate oxidase family protein [Dysgonamonadaceae bacterium]|nr:pyridoxamine 5'-phosphate oxidase family protein [Dysgonamonadaceae bacterium]